MINLELNKSDKRKKQRRLLKLLHTPHPKLRSMLPMRGSELPELRLRKIVLSTRHSSKPSMNSFSKDLLRRELLLKLSKLLKLPSLEESKLKHLLRP